MNDFYDQTRSQEGKWWLWILIVIFFLTLGCGGFWYWKNRQIKESSNSLPTVNTEYQENVSVGEIIAK